MKKISVVLILLILMIPTSSFSAGYDEICESGHTYHQRDVLSLEKLQSIFTKEEIEAKAVKLDRDNDGKIDQVVICFDGNQIPMRGSINKSIKIVNPYDAAQIVIHKLHAMFGESGNLSLRDNTILNNSTITGNAILPIYIKGKNVILQNTAVVSDDIAIEIRSAEKVRIEKSDIRALAGISLVDTNDVKILKTSLVVSDFAVEVRRVNTNYVNKSWVKYVPNL